MSPEEIIKCCEERLKSFEKDMVTINRLMSRYGVVDTNECVSLCKLLKKQETKYHAAINTVKQRQRNKERKLKNES